MTFNRSNLVVIRGEIETALAQVAKRHGISTIKLGKITFGPAEFRASITAEAVATPGCAPSWHANALYEGLDPTAIGPNGERLTGYRPRAPKHPWLYSAPDGKTYKASAAYVKFLFSGAKVDG